jgi:hypothetical protein
MSEELKPEEQESIKKISKAIATQLSHGVKKETIVKQLVKQNISEEVAISLVESVERAINQYKESPEGQAVMSKKYGRQMLYGVLWAVGGTLVTIFTYSAASSGGGTYVIAWGAIIFGIVDFIRGLIGWLKYKS